MKEISLVTQISEDLNTKPDHKDNRQGSAEKAGGDEDFTIEEKYAFFVRIKMPQWITKTQKVSPGIYLKEHA
tara:strand:- start:194 stop:409 length:216 start_codon:yes stop_codon:yes gene_type:complete